VTIAQIPALNACLNALSASLLVLGFVLIKRGRRRAHRNAMVAALVTSAAFLASYLYYHWHAGATRFTGVGTIRTVYFSILISHTVLAAAVPVLVGLTVVPALRGRFERHRRLARWTLPIWLYVSVTGVLIYVLLYQLYPAA
jgi:putative membrane protein